MPTVIDALVVTLDLTKEGYEKGQKDARAEIDKTRETATRGVKETEKNTRAAEAEQRKQAEAAAKRQKDLDAQTKNLGDTFAKVRNSAIAMLAAFTAGRGLSEFATSTTTTNANLGRLAANLGMTTEEMSAWQGASRLLGGSAEGINQSLGTLTSQFQGLRLGMQMPASDWLAALHISPAQLSTATGGLRAIGDALARVKKVDPARANFLRQQLGINDDAYNLITSPDRDKLLKEGASLSAVTEQQTAEAAKLQKALSEVEQISTRLGTQILTDLTPAFINVLNALRDLGLWLAEPKNKLPLDGLFVAAAGGAVLLSARIAMSLLGLGRLAAALVAARVAGVASMEAIGAASTAASATVAGGLLATIGAVATRLGLAGAALATWYLALRPGGANNEDEDLKSGKYGVAPNPGEPAPPGAVPDPSQFAPPPRDDLARRPDETLGQWLERRGDSLRTHGGAPTPAPAAPVPVPAMPAPAPPAASALAPVAPAPALAGPAPALAGPAPALAGPAPVLPAAPAPAPAGPAPPIPAAPQGPQRVNPSAQNESWAQWAVEEPRPSVRTTAEEFSRAIAAELSRVLSLSVPGFAQAAVVPGVGGQRGFPMVNEQPPSSAPSQVPPTAAAQGATAPTGQSLVDLVKGFEGYVDHAEWDYKQWTSGYGTRASGPDEKIDRPEAERRLAAELAKSAAAVDNDARRAGIALNENQRNALISFDYNTGSAAKVLAASGGDLAKVASGMADYIHAGGQVNNGLVERRRAEGALFNRPVSAASIQPPAPVPSAAAVQPEAGLAVRPGQRQPAQSVTTTTTTTAETHIGAVTIHTAATDARGIVRDFAGEVRRRSLALQANTGLT